MNGQQFMQGQGSDDPLARISAYKDHQNQASQAQQQAQAEAAAEQLKQLEDLTKSSLDKEKADLKVEAQAAKADIKKKELEAIAKAKQREADIAAMRYKVETRLNTNEPVSAGADQLNSQQTLQQPIQGQV